MATALATACSVERPKPKPPILMHVIGAGEDCRVEAEGRTFSIDQLSEVAPDWRPRGVSLKSGVDTPYKCVGSVIFTLQRAGLTKIGFIAEPPPRD